MEEAGIQILMDLLWWLGAAGGRGLVELISWV